MDGVERSVSGARPRAGAGAGGHANDDRRSARGAVSRAVAASRRGLAGGTQAKTYAFENLIVTVLRDVFTTVEST